MIARVGTRMSNAVRQIAPRTASQRGGVLCRPQATTVAREVWNRGVSDPQNGPAISDGPRPRRVAHAPLSMSPSGAAFPVRVSS